MKKSQIYIIENYTGQLFAITGLNEITIKEFEHRSYIVGVSEGGTAIIANIEFNIGNIDDIKKVKDYLGRYGLNFEVIKESDFRKIASINTVKLTKVKNPFFEWVDSNVKFTMNLPSKKTLGNPLQGFYIPSDDVLDKIYEWLGLNYDKLSNLRNVQIAKAFAYLWHSSHFNEFDIKIEDSFLITPDAKIPIVSTTIVSKTTHRDYKIIYIGGFLSLPHLTKILQQYQIFPNDLNPFRKFKGMNFYPDISIVQSLFDKFKVINIDKLLPYESDYKMIFPDQKANIDQVYRQHFADEEVIPIVSFTGTINYLERLPINVMKRLEQLVENRKGARGDIKDISKDLLSVIINGNLKGKDLISLCESNAMIGKKCDSDDQAIFKRALKHEFNITFEYGLYDYESAKDMYIQAYDLAYVLTYKGVKLKSVEVFRPSAFQLEKNQVIFIPTKEFAEYNKHGLDSKMFVNFHENKSFVFMYAELSEEYIVSNQLFKNQIDNEPYFELFIEYVNMEYQLSESSTINLNSLKRFWFESTKIDCIRVLNY